MCAAFHCNTQRHRIFKKVKATRWKKYFKKHKSCREILRKIIENPVKENKYG